MRYSVEPKNTIYVKGCGFFSFAKSLSNKYSQKRIDTAKKSTTDAKKLLQKEPFKKQQNQLVI